MIQNMIVIVIGVLVALYLLRAIIRFVRKNKNHASCCGCSGCGKESDCFKDVFERKVSK
ncbi:FeoB-associated Cys-rich membrane protein [Coprobacter sp.]